MENSHYKTSYKVRIADANSQARLKIPALFEMLQEAATEHAQNLGVDFSSIAPLGLGWALTKMSVELYNLPKWNERVYIDTWPSERERITTHREFIAQSADNTPYFSARSQWVLFDLNTRRLARMERLKDFLRDPNKLATAETFDTPLKRPAPNPQHIECHVRNNDIDLNGHVNNSIYIVWAIQSLDDDFLKKMIPSKIQINFLEEVKMHESVKSICEIQDNMSLHSIVNVQTQRECARINIQWQQI